MALATPRPLWGWTATARGWLALVGASAAVALMTVSGTTDGPTAPEPRLIVDPNTAPEDVLGALPKLGPALVRRIVAARDEAPFRSLDDLDRRVRGIGPATLASLRPFLHIPIARTTTAGASPPLVALPEPKPQPQARPVRLARTP